MELFTGWQYLLIDVANQIGLDKLLFGERIDWAEENLDRLEELAEEKGDWKERPLYLKAVQAIRKAQQGKPTGHKVGLDAVCSGMQIMSAITGCHAGANATGLIDPNRRADAYTDCTSLMRTRKTDRSDVKRAVMTSLYGSKKEPKNLFGDGTDELNAFYKAMYELAPGACELLQDLLESWTPYALAHEWVLPDGFHARVKVMEKVEKRIEVDELDHATFTYEYYENLGTEKGLSNVANVVHSIDAYLLRSLIRRCSYDYDLLAWASRAIEATLLERSLTSGGHTDPFWYSEEFNRLRVQYERSRMPDLRILSYCHEGELEALSSNHLKALARIINQCLVHKPFPIIAVHDEFMCHPNNMNHLRQHYINIFADMADSNILDDVLSQLHGTQGTFPKKSHNLSAKIRNSNYAIC